MSVYPVQAHAHKLVAAAIRRGDLTRMACEVCGNPLTDAHHEDYDRPLDVRWLCRKHHRDAHRDLPPGPREDGFVLYLLRIDAEKWAAFKARLSHEGHTVKWIIESLIDDYISHGLRKHRAKKKGKDTDA